jgi:hypothetical protein
MNETNEEEKFDLTRPFIAIVPDEVEGGYFEKTHAVYLVNPLGVPLSGARERIGGYFSTDERVIEADTKMNPPFDLAPHSAHLLERTSQDEFDELSCWWSIAYESNGQQHVQVFDAGKGLRGTHYVENCPVLNRSALIAGR